MAIHELSDVEMSKSGESVDFVSGTLLESEVDGNVHYDMVLKNVIQYNLFLDDQQSGEKTRVKFTTIGGQKGEAEMEVRTVNKEDPDNNIVELVTQEKIELS